MSVQIAAKIDAGINLTDANGNPLFLAVVDSEGRVVAAGVEVASQVFRAAVSAYDAFWQGTGHMATILPVDTAK